MGGACQQYYRNDQSADEGEINLLTDLLIDLLIDCPDWFFKNFSLIY